MATYDANKRAARVKLQLRDKNGLWIEMGKKAHWLSKTTGKKMSGTIVGIDGLNAYVLPPLENPTHEPMPFKISLKALGMYSPKADLKDHGRPKGTSDAEKVYQDKMMQKFDENYDENQKANAEKHKKAVESGKAGKHDNDAVEIDELGKEVPAEADETERDEAKVSEITENVKEILTSINDSDFEEVEEGITDSTTILDEDGNELTIEARKSAEGVRTIVLKDSDGNILESYDAKRTDGAFAQEIAEKVYDSSDAAEYDDIVDIDGDGIPDEGDPAIKVNREDYSETKIVPAKEDLDAMAEGDIVEQDGYTYIKDSADGWTGYEADDKGNLVVLKDEAGDVEFYDGETLADGSEFVHLTKSAKSATQKRLPKAPTEGVDNDNDGVADDREIDQDSDGDGIPDKDDPSGDSVVDSQQERTSPTVGESEEVPAPEPEAPQQDTLPGLEKPRRNQERIDELNVAADELEQKAVQAGRDQEEAVATRIAKIRELQEKADEGRYASDITRVKNAIASTEKFLEKPAAAPKKAKEAPQEEVVAEIPAEEAPQAETQDEPFGEVEEAELPEAEVVEEVAPAEAQPEPVQEAPEPASEPVAVEPAPATPAPAETPVAEPTAAPQEVETYIGKPTSVSDPVGTKYGLDTGEQFTKISDTSVANDQDSKDVMTPQEFDAEFDEVDAELPGNGPVADLGRTVPKTSGRELREYVNHWDQTNDNGDKYIPDLGDRLSTIRDTKESVDIDLSEYHQNDSVNSLGISYTDGRLIEIGDRIMYRSGKTHSDKDHPEYTDAYHEVEVIGFDSQGKVNMLPIDSVDYYTHDSKGNALYVSKPLEGVLARGSKKGFMHATPSKLSDFDGKRIYKSSDIPTNRPDAIRILTEREAEFRGADGELLEVGEPVRFRHRDHDRTIMVKDPVTGEEVPTRGPSYNKIFEGTIVSLNPAVQSAVINISNDPETEQLITASLVYSVSGDSSFDPPTPSSYATGKGLPELPEGFTRHLRRVFYDEDLESADSEGQTQEPEEFEQEPEVAPEAESEEVPEPEPATAPQSATDTESEPKVVAEPESTSEPVEAESLPTTADPAVTVAERERVKDAFGDLEEFDAPRPVRKGVTKSVFKGTEDWKSEYGRFFRDTDKQEFTSDRAKARHIASEAPIGSSVVTPNGGRATRTSKETWDFKSRRGGLVERDMSNANFAKKLLESDADLLNNANFRAPNKTSYSSYNKESIDQSKKNVDNAIRKAGNGATISSAEGILTKDGQDWYNDRGEISGIPENYSLVSLVPASTISTLARVGQDDLESVSVAVNQGLFRKTSNGWETRDLDTVPSTITDDELQEIMLNNSSDDLVDSVFVPDNEVLSVQGNTVRQLVEPTLDKVRNNPYKTPRGTVVSSTNKVNGAEVKSTLVDPATNLWRNEVSTPDNSILRSATVGSLSKSHDHSDAVDIVQPNFKLDHDTIDAFYEATAKDYEAYNEQDLSALMNLGHTPVDFSTMTMEEIVGTFQEKFGDELSVGIYDDRGEINYGDQNILGAKKVLEGYYQIRSKYPWMQSLGGIHIDKSDRDSTALAYIKNVDMSQAGEKIDLVIQSKAADGTAEAFLEGNSEYGSHFMPASDPSRYIGHHETGHIVDGHRFAKDGEGVDVLADWVAEFLGMSLAQLEDMTYDEIMEALNRKGYTSGYGFADIYKNVPESKNPFAGVNNYGIYKMDHFEVVAEAFADVEQNGSKASPVSKFIWKKLVTEAQLRAMYFRDTGELPSLDDLKDYQEQIK